MAQNQQEPKVAPLAIPDSESTRLGLTPLMMDKTPSPIVVKIAHYKGKRRLSIRFHYWSALDLLRPTKRGIEIPIEYVGIVEDLIDQVCTQLKERT